MMPFSVVAGANVGVFVFVSCVSVWNNWIVCATRLLLAVGECGWIDSMLDRLLHRADFFHTLISLGNGLLPFFPVNHRQVATFSLVWLRSFTAAVVHFALSSRACLVICFFPASDVKGRGKQSVFQWRTCWSHFEVHVCFLHLKQ